MFTFGWMLDAIKAYQIPVYANPSFNIPYNLHIDLYKSVILFIDKCKHYCVLVDYC